MLLFFIIYSIAKYAKDVVFNSMQSSLTLPVVINNNISEGKMSFTVQLCRVSDPLEGVCIESTVTIVDDEGQLDIVNTYQLILYNLCLVLLVGITELQYDRNNYRVTIAVEILLGELCTECTVHATLTTTLVLTGMIMKFNELTLLHGIGDTNYTSTSSLITLSSGHTIDTMTNIVHGILKLYPNKSLTAIISELKFVNNNVPVNAAPSECQLNVLGGDSTVDCSNPSTSSTSTTSATSQTSVTSQTSITSQTHSTTRQTSVTSQTSMTRQTSVTSQTSMTSQTSVTSQTSMTSQTSVTSQTSMTSQASVTSQTSMTSQTSVTSQTSMTSQTSVTSQTSMTSQASVTSQTSMTSQTSVTSQTSIISQTSVTSQTSMTSQTSVTSQTSMTSQTSVTSQTSIISQTSVTSQTSMTNPASATVTPLPSVSPSWPHTTTAVVPLSPVPIVDDTNNKTTLYIILGIVIPVVLIVISVACIAVSVVLWRKRRAGNFPSRPSWRASRGYSRVRSFDSDPEPNVDDDIDDNDGKELVKMMSNPVAS